MDSVAQSQGQPGKSKLKPPRSSLSPDELMLSGHLLSRLSLAPDVIAKAVVLNPSGMDWSETAGDVSVLVAQNAAQASDGLSVAITGEPSLAGTGTDTQAVQVDAQALLALYRTYGKNCLTRLHGSWAVVIVDPQQQCILAATDRLGRQPLYFKVADGHVLIADNLSNLRTTGDKVEPDVQALYHYLYFHMVPAPVAAVSGFRKLAMAQSLELGADGQKLSFYWSPAFSESTPEPLPAARQALKAHLRTAVQRCTQIPDVPAGATGHTKIGAFLSGGLDSSTVAGMLSEIQGGKAEAYSIGFDAEGYDEMPYARLAARHFGITLHEHYVTPDDVVRALPQIAAAFDEPFGNSSVLPAYFCARMAAEDGVSILLAGDGGDELFAGNERYASQKIFERYRGLPAWLRSGLVEPLVRSLPAAFPLARKGRSFLRQANIPLPARLQYYSFLEQNSPDDVFTPAFMHGVDRARPLQLLNDIYHRPDDATTLSRMLYLDWQITLADNDLRKVNQACAMAGVKVRYPMLDDELVEFSTRIPSDWKLPGKKADSSKLRHFYKQSLTGWLPDETINKTKHGFGLPFGVWMKTHKPLQELAYENIVRLKSREIFLPGFLDKAVDNHRNGHAAYFGELIWVLMCLELWLSVNAPDYHCEQTL